MFHMPFILPASIRKKGVHPMTVERIDPDQMPASANTGNGRPMSLEASALAEMQVGDAIRFPCRWYDSPSHTISECSGRMLMYQAARRQGMTVTTVHMNIEGTDYIYAQRRK
tara:strand:+ start:162 stop:497 length:336 start_codon:yes stop_codon:yes gene_type:complete